METTDNYSRTVFVNCPFDDEYQSLFEAVVFSILSCGFLPRCSKESMNSDEIRINKITTIIRDSKYGIHDLSRVEFSKESKLPRFNMPLELGIFIGCQKYGGSTHKQKRYLVIDKEDYRYKKFISDISGQDIRGHHNNPELIIEIIREWLAHVSNKTIPGPRFHVERFKQFKDELQEMCKKYDWDYDKLTYKEYTQLITEFINSKTIEILNSEFQN
jgi:hypothetical protein